ncbi:MAPK regulated corepressor interacting protein 2-like [Chrysoperla carnea]|uniref:MAPK regulated corepressor interacting protein 2-like n=1 Tax=Chrysoperla carnea TaxID=189513 RepID=UPI001D06DF1D|nr:MAPK regulated corepressor interacting protein 2-like [Chrysoperla carnea]
MSGGTHGSYPSMNGSNHKRAPNSIIRLNQTSPPSSINTQHDDLIKYIFESWDKVSKEFHHGARSGSNSHVTVAYYQEREPNPMLKDFQPFDLEAWWGKKIVQNISATHAHNNGS